MKITLLGTGTSQGIPVIGCKCDTCLSEDPRDERLRCSLLVENKDTRVVVDVGPDFRMQMLRAKVDRLDAVVLTHEHNDHIIGLDDLRPFIFMNRKPIEIYGEIRVLNEIQRRFEYAFEDMPYPGAPRFQLIPIVPGQDISIGNMHITALRIFHGSLPILGFRLGDFAYLTDVNGIPQETRERLIGLEALVISALRMKPHHSHFSLDEALGAIREIAPQKAYLIHMSHIMGKTSEWETRLPENVFPAFDGLVIN